MQKTPCSSFMLRDLIACLICGFLFTEAEPYIRTASPEFSWSIALRGLLWSFVFIALTYLSLFLLNRSASMPEAKAWSRKDLLKHAGIMMLCWLPILIFLYPGSLSNDTWNQLWQAMMWRYGSTLNDQHPVFDTMLFAGIIYPVMKISGSWRIGFFVFVLLQAFITSLVLSASIYYCRNHLKISGKSSTLMMVIYCLFPLFPFAVQNLSKDSIYAWCYMLFLLFYLEILRTKGTFLKQRKQLFLFILVCMLCCFTKKTGMYLVFASLLFLGVWIHSGKLVLIGAVSFLLTGTIIPLAYPSLRITPGGEQEKYSVLFQQTARYVKEYPDDVTEEEKDSIDALLHYDTLAERYDPLCVDTVKVKAVGVTDSSVYQNWLKAWASEGKRHPDSYINAYFSFIAPLFSDDQIAPVIDSSWHGSLVKEYIPLSAADRPVFSAGTAALVRSGYEFLTRIPVINILFSEGLYVLLIPLFLIIQYSKQSENRILRLAVLPLFFSIVFGCLLAPVASGIEGWRYLISLIYSVPLELIFLEYGIRQDMRKSSSCLE